LFKRTQGDATPDVWHAGVDCGSVPQVIDLSPTAKDKRFPLGLTGKGARPQGRKNAVDMKDCREQGKA